MNALLSSIQKLFMKLEREYQDTYDKTFFYTIYMTFLLHNYHTEKSPFLLVTTNENTKQSFD
jgi:hypothetical protein